MTNTQYAKGTTVSSAASRAEIERTLAKYGAGSFMYGWDGGRAAIAFTMKDRQVRFVLPLPDPSERRFTHTPTGKPRAAEAAKKEYEAAVRQSWRALAMIVKAKLEIVASGILSFEEEFFANIVVPTSGKTVFQEASPAVESIYTTGTVKPLLQIGE